MMGELRDSTRRRQERKQDQVRCYAQLKHHSLSCFAPPHTTSPNLSPPNTIFLSPLANSAATCKPSLT